MSDSSFTGGERQFAYGLPWDFTSHPHSLPHHVKIVHDLLTEKDGESTYKIRCILDEVWSGVKFSSR